MPELPEVQTTVNGLQLIVKKRITSIKVNTVKLRYLVPNKIIKASNNKKILKIYRIAKYIIFELSGNITLILHLGMSGRIRLLKLKDYLMIKHDHILISLNNERILVFNDPRKFGFIDFSKTSELKKTKYFSKLGLDPFERKLNRNYLLRKFKPLLYTVKVRW